MVVEDAAAFCEREYPRLVGMLGLYTGDRELARDLAQEALARACANWPRVSRMDAPGAWVYRVAVNLARSWFRRRGYERRWRPAPVDYTGDRGDEAIFVRDAVAQLPRRQRLAVALRYFADLPVDDVARIMRCRPGTVTALTHQGVARLRVLLSDNEEVTSGE